MKLTNKKSNSYNKKKTLKWSLVFIFTIIIVILAGIYKFDYLASQEGYDVDGNKIDTSINTELNKSK